MCTMCDCVVPEGIHTPCMKKSWLEIPSGRGVKAKLLEKKYEVKLEFPGGRGGAKRKTFLGGSMEIF